MHTGRSGVLGYLERGFNRVIEQISDLLRVLGLSDIESILRIDWARAILGGILGTIIFDVLGFLLTGQWWDYPSLLAAAQGTGLLGGVIHHYFNGVVLAVNYASLAPSMRGSRWRRVLTYITVEAIVGAWLIALPLAGVGLIDLIEDPVLPLVTLLRHWGYGLTLALVYPWPLPARPPPAEERSEVGTNRNRQA